MEDNETWKEEYRKREEERVRAGEAAQARIDALIARAGGPMMICKNMKEADTEKKEQIMLYVRTISRRDFGGSVAMYFQHLIDTIDWLEAALYNTLNERDQLLADLNRMTNKHGSCDYCLHKNKSAAECKGCTHENDHWEWRGVPEVNDDDA
ncbi:MAG: hypothetical protein SPG80_13460 [Candidatus Ventricola sp.]|nr:hypothetical protein [Clostridiales bacterium]MDY5350524.1 hypothetical protein [Candidatus Ventricola sp.]